MISNVERVLKKTYKDAEKKGIEQGKEEGMEQGIELGVTKVARQMLLENEDIEKLIEEADEVAKAASSDYIDPTDEIFGLQIQQDISKNSKISN